MTPTETFRRERRRSAGRLLLVAAASLLLMAGCPLPQATYVLRRSGIDRMRIGPAADGEVILDFALATRNESIPLSQVIDRIQIERLDAARHPVPADENDAPAYIRIQGLAKISDVPDGEWRLARCSGH